MVGPVEEVLPAGEARVVEHLPRVDARPLARRVLAAARRGAVELGRVVAVGPRDRAVGAGTVVLQDGAPGQVLDDVARDRRFPRSRRRPSRLRGPGRTRPRRGRARRRGRFRPPPPSPAPRPAGRSRCPRARAPRKRVPSPTASTKRWPEENAKEGLGRRHLLEDAVGHVGLELGVADPAGADGLRAAVGVVDLLPELPPDPGGQAVVAVRGRDPGRGEHPPEPRRGLGDDRARSEAGALEGRADAARPAAHDEDVRFEHGRRAGARPPRARAGQGRRAASCGASEPRRRFGGPVGTLLPGPEERQTTALTPPPAEAQHADS